MKRFDSPTTRGGLNLDRRAFLRCSAAAVLAAGGVPALAAAAPPTPAEPTPPLTIREPLRAAVVWYSQTGHTARYGCLIARTLAAAGVEVVSGSWREIPAARLAEAHLLVVGSPVFYVDVPIELKPYLDALPDLAGRAAASYVTFGGPGDNQDNTAIRLMNALVARGAAPLGHATFGNMSAFAPTWSAGNPERTLKYRHLPDADTYARVREFARTLLRDLAAGATHPAEPSLTWQDLSRSVNMRWWTKLAINRHEIDPATCIACDACQNTCPVGAIDRAAGRIDRDRCVACLGCVNNCPTGALVMETLTVRVTGFRRFCELQGIAIADPPECADIND